jgi:hypothetical protein
MVEIDSLDGRACRSLVDVREDGFATRTRAIEEHEPIAHLETPDAQMMRQLLVEEDFARGEWPGVEKRA